MGTEDQLPVLCAKPEVAYQMRQLHSTTSTSKQYHSPNHEEPRGVIEGVDPKLLKQLLLSIAENKNLQRLTSVIIDPNKNSSVTPSSLMSSYEDLLLSKHDISAGLGFQAR